MKAVSVFLLVMSTLLSLSASQEAIAKKPLVSQWIKQEYAKKNEVAMKWIGAFIKVAEQSGDENLLAQAKRFRGNTILVTYQGNTIFILEEKRMRGSILLNFVSPSDSSKKDFGFDTESKIADLQETEAGFMLSILDVPMSQMGKGLFIAQVTTQMIEDLREISYARANEIVSTEQYSRSARKAFEQEGRLLRKIGGTAYEEFLEWQKAKLGRKAECQFAMIESFPFIKEDWRKLTPIFDEPASKWEESFRVARIVLHMQAEDCRKKGLEEQFYRQIFGNKTGV